MGPVSRVIHPPGVWTVRVDWTSTRPVTVDEHTSYVTVAAPTEAEAILVAAQIVHVSPGWPGRPLSVMPTRTTILYATF